MGYIRSKDEYFEVDKTTSLGLLSQIFRVWSCKLANYKFVYEANNNQSGGSEKFLILR